MTRPRKTPGKATRTWDGNRIYIVRRKWQAGMSSARIAQETGWGVRKIATLCAGFRAALGAVGGRFATSAKRRKVTAVVLVDDAVDRGVGRGRARCASLTRVNAAVRKHRQYKETQYYTTVKDARVLGPLRVLRGAVVRARRAGRLGDGGKARRALALRAAACAATPRQRPARTLVPE